jgi:hypothetical protein
MIRVPPSRRTQKPAVPSPPIAPTHIAQSSACGPRTI